MKTKLVSTFAKNRRDAGFLEVDLLVGMAILAIAILPLGFAFERERHVLRQEYLHSVADEIADGEMEILVAGDWKNYAEGTQAYPVHSRAAGTLPPGHFQLTRTGHHLRLEWKKTSTNAEDMGIGAIVREATIP